MKSIFITIIVIITASYSYSQNVSAEYIVEKYSNANGKEKLAEVRTIIMEGVIIRHDIMPVIYYRSRPDKYMMKYDRADITAYTVFDGKDAWYTAPWSGITSPEILTDDDAEYVIMTAEFGDMLMNSEILKHKVSFVKEKELNGNINYVLDVEHATTGIVMTHYVDKETLLLTKTIVERKSGENVFIQKTIYDEYKPVEGIMFPFRQELYFNDRRSSTTEFEEIILNPEINDELYSIRSFSE